MNLYVKMMGGEKNYRKRIEDSSGAITIIYEERMPAFTTIVIRHKSV
jgi:hypothetical protein